MEKDFLGIGISSKLQWIKYEDSIKESIKIILATRQGERVMRPDFGCGINDLVFSSLDSYTMGIIKENVKNSLNLWEKRIKDIKVSVSLVSDEGKLDINIGYTIIKSNHPDNLVYPFYLESNH